MSWTDERKAQLKAFVADGLSYNQIAERMGVSRNAAIGCGHRLGLATAHPPHTRGGPRKSRGAKTLSMKIALRRVVLAENVQGPELAELPPEQSANPVRLLYLAASHCRWPLGEGTPEFFCGDPVVHERPYCERHCRIAYRPAREPSLPRREPA